VSKLRRITVERGATQHEAAAALALAVALTARYGLDQPARSHPAVARYAAGARHDHRAPQSLRFVAFA